MAIVKMKKITLTALRSQKEELLRELILLGCVEVSEPDELLSIPEISEITTRETSGLDAYRAELAQLNRAVAVLKDYTSFKSKMFAPRTDVTVEDFFDESRLSEYLSLASKLDELDNNIRHMVADEAREKTLIESLIPWETMSLPFDSEGTRTCGFTFGTLPALCDITQLERTLAAEAPQSQIFEISRDDKLYYISAVYLTAAQTALDDVLRSAGYSASPLRSMRGTARDNLSRRRSRIEERRSERESMTARIVAEADKRDAFLQCIELVNTKISRAESSEKLLATERSVSFNGWVSVPEVDALTAALSRFDCVWELFDPDPEEYPEVPIKLQNNKFTRPFNMVTEMYSLPTYDNIDPNPLLAPFFMLFYGIMMADMGYGLVMILMALIVKRKDPRGGARNFFDLMLLCGISTFIMGIVTGGIFADAPQQFAALIGKSFALPYKPLFDPVQNTMMVLIGALALGMIHIIAGMAISFAISVRDGHPIAAIFDVGSWWVVFAGIALGALGVTWWVAIAGALMLVVSQGRAKPTIMGKITSGLGSLYNITAYFGDVLSYSRLMALMLAGSVVANVFNTIGSLTGNPVAFLVIALIGHSLNFGLNLLGCYVHDLRLQCLEFFGKFYSDGGRPFTPLSITTKYVDIVK